MWARVGEFPDKISFQNTAIAATFRQIDMELWAGRNSIVVTLFPSCLVQDDVIAKCKDLFQKKLILMIWEPRIKIHIDSITAINTLEKLIKYFDTEKNRSECIPSLIEDIFQLYHAHKMELQTIRLKIPEAVVSKAHVNPETKKTNEFDQFYHSKLSLNKLKSLLVKGHDPNQLDFLGRSFLYTIFLSYHRNMLEFDAHEKNHQDLFIKFFGLLIYYCTEFLAPVNTEVLYSQSIYELVYSYRGTGKCRVTNKCLEIMNNVINYNTTSAIKRSLRPQIQIESTQVYSDHNSILSVEYHLANHTLIEARLVQASNLSDEMKDQCFQIFSKYFKDPSEFAKAFGNNKNVLINLIFHKTSSEKKLVGFSVVEILNCNNTISFHVWYIGAEAVCRNGFVPLITRALAFATQISFPNNTVACYFNPVDFYVLEAMGAFEMPSTPKYQSPSMVSLVEGIHAQSKAFADGLDVHHDTMTWCIKTDPILVAERDSKQQDNNPNKTLYEQFFKLPNSEVVACNLVADLSQKDFSNKALMLGLDGKSYLEAINKLLSPFVARLTQIKPDKSGKKNWQLIYCDELSLFYTGKRKPAKNQVTFTSPPIRARL